MPTFVCVFSTGALLARTRPSLTIQQLVQRRAYCYRVLQYQIFIKICNLDANSNFNEHLVLQDPVAVGPSLNQLLDGRRWACASQESTRRKDANERGHSLF